MASSSSKRKSPTTEEEHHAKKNKQSSSSSHLSPQQVHPIINPADCDLDFIIRPDKLTGSGLFHLEFAYCWSGARGNIRITGGKYWFGCTILLDQPVMMKGTPLDQRHVARVGISRGDAPVGSLGETEHSFCYDGNKQLLYAGRVVEYGETFGEGDTIVCLVDLERKPLAVVEFSKNGKRLGPRLIKVSDSPAGKLPWDSAVFPHVLLKNTMVRLQFNTKQGLVPEEGYKPWDLAMEDGNAIFGPDFSDPKDCEVIMMVGLPASGKTTWAEKWVKAHPEKRYILLGTDLALDKMMVPDSLRKSNNDGIYDRLRVRATNMVNTLCLLAAKVSRNYILDDCNQNKDSRREKLKHFASFHKVAVVVFPSLAENTARSRKRSKETVKEESSEDLHNILDTFSFPMSKEMPKSDEDFDEVIFTDLSDIEAQQILIKMKHYLPKLPSHDSSVYLGTGHSRIDRSEPAVQVDPANVNSTELSRGEAQWHHNSLSSDSMMAASFSSGLASHYLGFPSPSLEMQTNFGTGGSLISQFEPTFQTNPANLDIGYAGAVQPAALSSMQPFPNNVNVESTGVGQPYAARLMQPISNNVNIGDTRAGQPNALESLLPFPNNVNTITESYYGRLDPSEPYFPLGRLSPMPPTDWYPGTYATYNNPVHEENRGYPIACSSFRDPVPGNNLAQHGSYVHDSYGTRERTGTPGYGNHVQDTRSESQPAYVSQHGTPNPMPQTSYPADAKHHGTAPYHPPTH